MRRTIVNTILTTGISIIGLTLYFAATHKSTVLIHTILELFGANIIIHICLHIRDKFEIFNVILEHIIEISYTLVILVVFGILFNWFSSVPVWILILSGIIIYIITAVLTISKINKDTNEINELLQKLQD